ncbi:Hypothetical protein NCS54_01230000 [Fusarium falciforme]|uniref:Hypothetical protein n=1 Tax=Fusarium falciforme TaxID=195108 RepID=UPI0023013B9A|nr:Hypothetical protein NCS54_01230000 [Fusarium falciforme]WAO94705.1 Hypothetical protein NCS54_01230000 [Fusarium falciforme]
MKLFKGMYQSFAAWIVRVLRSLHLLSHKEWQIQLRFSSDPENLLRDPPQDTTKGWTASLDLVTSDLPSLMHDGLYLTPENVRELENHVQRSYSNRSKRYFLSRYFTVVDLKWSGKLCVTSWDYEPVGDFRIHHLSADKVYNAQVLNKDGNAVYYYDMRSPGKNANYIYDDMPMSGLWPFPRKEEGVKDQEVLKREGEHGDQGEEEERKETEEGEGVLKDEGGGNEGGRDAEGGETEWEDGEMGGFPDWEYGDSMIDSWQD